MCGFTSIEGYEHSASKAERDGKFVGLISMICLKAVLKIGLTSSRVKVSSKNEPDITVLRLQGYSVSCDVFQQT